MNLIPKTLDSLTRLINQDKSPAQQTGLGFYPDYGYRSASLFMKNLFLSRFLTLPGRQIRLTDDPKRCF